MINKKILLSSIILLLVGAGIFFGDFFLIKNTVSFLDNSEKTEGSVINIIKSISSDSGNYMYRPEISFVDNVGKTITFTSNVSNSFSSYKEGEKVPVLYNKNNPQNAEINTFFHLWGGVFALTFMGVVFFFIGLFSLIKQIRKSILKNNLLSKGTKISAKVISVESSYFQPSFSFGKVAQSQNPKIPFRWMNSTTLSKNYQIITQWLNPADNKMYVFKSDALTYNPESLVQNKEINVFIDPINPKKYYMDISTLPRVGN